jgi:two-component system, cell cycle response regulator DivK
MKKVLVVEDNPDTRLIYQTALEHYGYEVVEAANGAEGVRAAEATAPDVIIMNLAMPMLDGLGATAALRQDARTARIPVIACTGYVRDDGAEEAREAGVDVYLEKPCEPSRLIEEVARLIGPPTAARSETAD